MATTTQSFEVMQPEEPRALVVQPVRSEGIVLMPVMDITVAKQRLAEFQEFVKGYMIAGEDYGNIPGVSKPSLFKPGAEKLCELYGLADSYPEDKARRIENWDTGLFFYEFTCVLTKKGTDIVIGEGKGSCNSFESRYRFRDANRKCPACHKEAIIKGKEEYGGGWLCFKKKGGCGAKFKDGDPVIEGQESGKVQNENLPDVMNTVLKMAKKRAKIDAVIGATRSSGIFTQDVEDQGTAAAAPEDRPVPGLRSDAISGAITDIKRVKGDLWLRLAKFRTGGEGEVLETSCKVPVERRDLMEKLEDKHGYHVELLVELRTNTKDKKQFYVVKGLLDIADVDEPSEDPLEITNDDIPF